MHQPLCRAKISRRIRLVSRTAMAKMRKESCTLLRNISVDQRGYVMIKFAVLLPIMLGIIGLTIDLARFSILDTQLRDVADAAALAGAAKMNGEATGVTNAG